MMPYRRYDDHLQGCRDQSRCSEWWERNGDCQPPCVMPLFHEKPCHAVQMCRMEGCKDGPWLIELPVKCLAEQFCKKCQRKLNVEGTKIESRSRRWANRVRGIAETVGEMGLMLLLFVAAFIYGWISR